MFIKSISSTLAFSHIPSTSSYYARALWYRVGLCIEKEDKNCLRERLTAVLAEPDHYQRKIAEKWFAQLE